MNVSLRKEFIVLIAGPMFQFVGYYILINLSFFNNYIEMITSIHYAIIFFNMLPIYPLDGGKLLNIVFNYYFNFNRSFKYIIYISYFIVIVISIYYFKNSITLTSIFMILFLIYKITEESRNKRNYYNKFLLDRYLDNNRYRKYKKIESINDFYRDKTHLIKGKDRFYTEREILNKKFKNKY
jgi:stage IV sporulation protein FB